MGTYRNLTPPSREVIPELGDNPNESVPYWIYGGPGRGPVLYHMNKSGSVCVVALDGYNVTTRGIVTPSVVCRDCDYHEFVTLDGWGGKEIRNER